MNLSKIKMVVSDMDGTLLNSGHQVSDHFFELFRELKRRNILFVAASGRQYHSIVQKLEAIRDDIFIVSENGAYVKYRNRELLTTPLPQGKVKIILKIIAQYGDSYAVLCNKDNAYINNSTSKDFLATLSQYYTHFKRMDFKLKLPNKILKVAIYSVKNSEANIYQTLKHMENELKVKLSGPNWVDVSNSNAHKGYAIKKLITDYNIKPDELMVFGDYKNDLEMLALTKYSFAMKNAHPDVLKASNYTTTSNDDFGVERVLEKLIFQ